MWRISFDEVHMSDRRYEVLRPVPNTTANAVCYIHWHYLCVVGVTVTFGITGAWVVCFSNGPSLPDTKLYGNAGEYVGSEGRVYLTCRIVVDGRRVRCPPPDVMLPTQPHPLQSLNSTHAGERADVRPPSGQSVLTSREVDTVLTLSLWAGHSLYVLYCLFFFKCSRFYRPHPLTPLTPTLQVLHIWRVMLRTRGNSFIFLFWFFAQQPHVRAFWSVFIIIIFSFGFFFLFLCFVRFTVSRFFFFFDWEIGDLTNVQKLTGI